MATSLTIPADKGRGRLGAAFRWAILCGLAFTLAVAAILFTRETGRVAAIWPVNAVFLVFLLRASKSRWTELFAALFIGNTAANLAVGDSLVQAMLFAAANMTEVAIVAYFMRRRGSARLLRRSSIIRFVKAALVACAASTMIAGVTLTLFGDGLPLRGAAIWFAADALGLLLFTPMLWIVFAQKGRTEIRQAARAMVPELALVLAATLIVFAQTRYPLLFLVPPALVFLAFRRGLVGATAGLALITVLGVAFTFAGRGPTLLIDGDLPVRMLVLQCFLAANALMALSVGAAAAERKKLIGRLKVSRARMVDRSESERVLIDQARLAERMGQVGYWTLTPATGEVFWSAEVFRIHGVTPETFNPSLGDALQFYPPEDRAKIEAVIARSLAEKSGWQFEADLQHASGKLIRVRSMAECRLDAADEVVKIFGVFKDITLDHEMLEKVKEQESLYRLLADNSSDVIARYGEDSIFTYLSPSIEHLLGYKPADLIGKSTRVIVHPDDLDRVLAAYRKGLTSGEPFAVEYRAVHRDGSVLWLEARPTVTRDDSGQFIEFIDTVRDVTDRHERELALADATRAAEAATRLKAAFLSNMSHEIRTPLNGILGFADLLSKAEQDDERERYIRRIQAAGRALLHVVNDILDFSKIEAGRMSLEPLPYDPRELTGHVVELVRAALPENDIGFSLSTEDDVAPAYVGDEGRIRQILTNVIGNAAKFTRKGSVDVRIGVEGDQLVFVIRDDGPGIPPDRLPHVFEGFSQAEESVSRKFGGTGLGLSISRSLARLMGGDLTLSSAVGEGTVATLTLPAVRGAPQRVRQSDAPAAPPGRGARVMIVDDIEMNRELVELGLGRAGHVVEGFASGDDALAALRAGEVYDVILMDVQMPGMDGLEATRQIRRLSGETARTPVVGLTANVLPEQAAACRAAGMDDHVGKPVDMDQLATLVGRLIRREDRGSAAPSSSDDEAMNSLKARYLAHLSDLPGQLHGMLQGGDSAASGETLAALAHSIAGTAGSLGFKDVSGAAFQLEAAGRRAHAGEAGYEELAQAVESLVAQVTRVTHAGAAPDGGRS